MPEQCQQRERLLAIEKQLQSHDGLLRVGEQRMGSLEQNINRTLTILDGDSATDLGMRGDVSKTREAVTALKEHVEKQRECSEDLRTQLSTMQKRIFIALAILLLGGGSVAGGHELVVLIKAILGL